MTGFTSISVFKRKMINKISQKLVEKVFLQGDYKNLERMDKKLRSFYLNPFWGKLIRSFFFSQLNTFLRKKDYSGLRAVNMILNRIEEQSGFTVLQSMPFLAHINLTSMCNLRCIMCFQAHDRDMERVHMSHELLEDVSSYLFPYLKTIKMDASGEALLYPDFKTMLDLCARYGNELQLTTNGTRLTDDLTHRLLAFNGLKHFCVSFDAITKEVFEKIRINARFDDVHSKFAYFCKKRKELGRDDILVSISFTAMRQNIDHLPKLVELAHEWGINVIFVAYAFISGTSDPRWSLYFDQDRTNRIFDEAYEKGSKLGVGIHLPLRFGQGSDAKWRKCSWAWSSVYIHPNGIIGPCCVIQYFTQTDDSHHQTDKREHSLTTKKFNDIWNGPSFKKLRATVNTDSAIYSHCRSSCPVFGRGNASEINKHFDPTLYPDKGSLNRIIRTDT
jgi:MoaA/NifB/PqqE/SkfB family radical SAM enzyme